METTADKIRNLLSSSKNLAHMSINSDIFSSTLKKEASNVLECIPQILKLLEERELKRDLEVSEIELLEDYSKFLEESGYTDTDWWQEKPTSIESYLVEIRKRKS